MGATKSIHKKIFIKGIDRTDDVKIFRFFDNKCLVIFKNDKKFFYNANNVEIIEYSNSLSSKENKPKNNNDFLKYFNDLAASIGLEKELDDGSILNILSNQYSKIESPSVDSLFSCYLNGKLSIDNVQKYSKEHQIIYPFGFNSSQKKAVDTALSSRLSIIEGPPGTGKTQTILNIISNAIIRGQTVAVVSSNNSATQNVLDKLTKYDLNFLVASLGSKANKARFIEEQPKIPKLELWTFSDKERISIRKEITKRQIELEENIELNAQLYKYKRELSELELEAQHFEKHSNISDTLSELKFIKKVKTSKKALDLWLSVEYLESKSWTVDLIKSLGDWLVGRHSSRFFIRKLRKQLSNQFLINVFQQQFYNLKILELKTEIQDISNILNEYKLEKKLAEYTNLSMKLFNSNLERKYSTIERPEYELSDLKSNTKTFLKDYPVILSTTYSIKNTINSSIMYDYLIIDESSQVDICTGALALSCAHNVVVVGDLNQLSHVVNNETVKISDEIFNNYELPESYRYKSNSLLSSLIKTFPEAPRTLLREHYRCSPKIIEFCNKKFYNDQLIIMTNDHPELQPLLVYKAVAGNHERERMNQRQIDMILEEIIPEQSLNTSNNTLGIISPYRKQTNQLQKAFANTQVEADTVDKFQGREKHRVILSTVDNDITDFTDNKNRLNVAISRAIDQLILVINESVSLEDTNIGDLVSYIEYNNLQVINSKVESVFDNLYNQYESRRKLFLSRYQKVSEYDSENLMHTLIKDVLKEERFSNLGITAHVNLSMLIQDKNLLDSNELEFAENPMTHVDFVVFNKLGKQPKLIIEVDGARFHKEGSKQSLRDGLKDQILKKYDLPILRFRTDGSNEKTALIKKLEEILKAS